MFPNVEVRHLHAVIVLGEELNFTQAAHRLHLSQSALSKQITEIEEQHRFRLVHSRQSTSCPCGDSPTPGESSSKRLARPSCILSELFILLVPPMRRQGNVDWRARLCLIEHEIVTDEACPFKRDRIPDAQTTPSHEERGERYLRTRSPRGFPGTHTLRR